MQDLVKKILATSKRNKKGTSQAKKDLLLYFYHFLKRVAAPSACKTLGVF